MQLLPGSSFQTVLPGRPGLVRGLETGCGRPTALIPKHMHMGLRNFAAATCSKGRLCDVWQQILSALSCPSTLRLLEHGQCMCRQENVVAIDLITEHIRMKLQQPELRRIYVNLEVIPSNYQIRGMHTIIRDASTSKADFVFYADRLLRLVRPRPQAHRASSFSRSRCLQAMSLGTRQLLSACAR